MRTERVKGGQSMGKMFLTEQGRSMGRMLLTDLRRAFGGWTVWVGALLLFVTLVMPVAMDIFRSDPASLNAVDRFFLAFAASGAPFLAPVLCCLPMGVSFCDDYVTGFGRLVIQRTGIKRYLMSRILSAAFSGGCTMFLGMALYIGFCFLVFTGSASSDPNLANYLEAIRSFNVFTWLPEGFAAGYWLMAAYWLQYTLWGAVWAVAGLAISALVTNRYASLALPFISVITLGTLFGRLRLLYLSPYSYLNPLVNKELVFFSSYWGLLLGFGIQLVLFGGIFYLVGRRRLLNG